MEFQFVNTLGAGASADLLMRHNMDTGVLRPYMEEDLHGRLTGRNKMVVNTWRKGKDGDYVYEEIYTNSPAFLRREDWLRIDRDVMWAAKLRLTLWGDVYGTNPYDVPDGFSTMAIQHAVATGDADAVISMDGMRKSERNRPLLDVGILPLPIIHSDGSFSMREVAVARKSGAPLDTTMIQLSARKTAEIIEQMTLGTWPVFTFAGGSIYGLRNFPYRVTKTITSPLTGSYNPSTTVTDVLGMIQALEDILFYGPYVLYVSTGWGKFFDADYTNTNPSTTLRARLGLIGKISAVRTVDYLPDYEMILVQMTPDVIQGVQGMPFRTVQWLDGSGMEWYHKTMVINVPRIRTNYRSETGICHAVGSLGGTTTSTTTTTTTTT